MHIVLVEPEIPQNTGNIARTCAATNTSLHLVEPLGFTIDDKYLKRAGLDYWEKVNIYRYKNLEHFFEENKGGRFFYLTTKGKKGYHEVTYKENDFLMFGKETKGLPEDLIYGDFENAITVPMAPDGVRSLNLSNTVALVLYEGLRQLDFKF
ncbi:tRNA (uridine(34)/cytosine(34)/5-carboxymethylaminomethyluridine(34)-2'-O)-methyltransferase TrmL [Alkalicella caledoniensis]|uniref:Putative tRNA (cytidine(34)-2'-O)-methyltransferase n=1 Tax=Alkalicella caledoniensis TaxID=2731377 RepID=A0A7G9WAC1_ALKCA|nr:tRNA (uridine(34)/cytosine(34)/5-carboxymethylaminomethyluridine(34)-2'-O)-methyltransferase TrmL [Alkalicella caledoniensis]QNO15633.1 tRNA (uridine(34)/cytosine(34)/5-carboxymethylaminomethyluridine(34)-2'-O)-methyltransferase TrmL [Alkalicella caledoniensis]